MSQPSDFSFDDAELISGLVTAANEPVPMAVAEQPPTASRVLAAAPVIVVEGHASQGLVARLTPPALILLAAVAITSYRRTQPVRYLVPRIAVQTPALTPSATADEKIVVRAEKSGHSDNPVEAVTPEPSPNEKVASKSEAPPAKGPDTDVSPFEIETPEMLAALTKPIDRVIPFDLNPKVAISEKEAGAKATPGAPKDADPMLLAEAVVPPKLPEVSKEDIILDIQREADQKADQNKELSDLKPQLQALNLRAAVVKINAKRTAYHDDLRRVLNLPPPNAATEIDRLNAQYGKDMHPEVAMEYKRSLRKKPGRLSNEAEVYWMRSVGLPETAIFEYLANKVVKTMKTRGGPRDDQEVKVFTAKLLLKYPVKLEKKSAQPIPTSNTRPVASARAPGVPAARP